jgi:MFS family permease
LVEKLFIQGLIIAIVLIIIQLWLNDARDSFMSYMPPLGFAFLITITYFVQPLIIGVLNIIVINTIYRTKGWQVGFWLNGIFLLLTFSTINLLLQTTLGLPFFPQTAIIDVLVLSIPFGCIARFSNGGWKKPID